MSLGAGVSVTRSIPLTIMALVDSTSLRTAGNYNAVIAQGDYNTAGGLSWQLEISAAASPALVFSAATSTGTGTYSTTQDSTGGPVVTANTGWWLVAACVRHVTNTLAVQYYAYRFNTGTLTTAAGSTTTFVSGTTQFAAPTGTTPTTIAAEGSAAAATDWFPGAFAWVGVWNADLSFTQNANPPALWEAISHGPLALADSTLAGLWILDNSDAHDYSTGAHNGTYQASPTFVGTPVNYLPLVAAYRTTAVAGAATVTGTLTGSPDVFTAALAGTSAEVGTIAAAPNAFTASLAGWATVTGTVAAAPAAFTAALAGQSAEVGTIAATPGIFTASLAGSSTPPGTSGTITGSPAVFAASLAGTSAETGTIAAAPAPFTAALSGWATVTGAIAAAPAAFTTTATGQSAEVGTIAVTPAVFTASLAGTFTAAGGLNPPQMQTTVGASGSGGNDFAQTLVRDSGNRLWLGTFTAGTYGQNPGNQLRIYKADTTGIASSYTEQDTAHRPANVGTLSLAIDGSDVIHVAWQQTFTTPGGVFYQTFNTATGLWVGSATQIGATNWSTSSDTVVGDAGVSLALDASGVPHVLYMGRASTATPQHIQYVNKVGGTWSTAAQLDTATLGTNFNAKHPAIMFDSAGALHATWLTMRFNYDTGGGNATAYYAKRSSGGTWGAITTFAETLLGSIDNGPSLYVDPADVVHITYNLGAPGVNPVGEGVTGATVDNQVYYRYSTDGGATWVTTTQPAHFVTHDPALGPDGAGGVFIWCHSQPTTVDGVGGAIGAMHRPKGSATWSAWTQRTTGTPSSDSTVSVRRAQFFHSSPTKLDIAYFGDTLPITAYVGSDLPSTIAAQPAAFTTALSGTVSAPPTTGTIAAALAVFTASLAGTSAEVGVIAGSPGVFTASFSGTSAPPASGTIAATPGIFTAALSGTAAETGTIAALPGAFVSAMAGQSVGPGVAGTMPTAAGAFAAALAGLLSETGTIAATPGAFVSSMAGTTTPPPVSGTIVAIPGLFVLASAGSVPVSGAVVTLMGTVVTLLAGSSGALVVLGTATLSDRQLTTIALSDGLVTRVVLTCTDEEGVPLNSYVIGNVVSINVLVKDINLALVDAATTTVTVKPQGGTPLVVTPTRLSTGTLQYNWDTTANVAPGTYGVRAATTNPNAAAEAQIYIEPTLLT